LTTDNGANYVSGSYFGEYTTGVTGSRNDSGTVTFTVPVGAPSTLYYQCGVHGAMRGVITTKPLAVAVNNNGNYIVYAQHSQEGHAVPVEIRPVPTLTSQMCLVYDAVTDTFVPQDLATYVERTPAFRNKIQEVAGTATLIAPDGTSIVASVQVISDASYLPYSGNTDGDIAYTQDNQTLYIWDETSYAWASTKGESGGGGGGGVAAVELSGPSQASELSTVTFTITNYDAGAAYILSVTGGSATRSAAVVTWKLPSVSTDTVHYINAQAIAAGVNSGISTANITVNSVLIDDDTIYISNFYGTKKGWES
jgi:hypothetical protein